MNKRKKKKLYYGTKYAVYKGYETAEGGFPVFEHFPLWSIRGTYKALKKALQREYNTDKNYVEIPVFGKAYDQAYIIIEHNKGQHTRTYNGYC